MKKTIYLLFLFFVGFSFVYAKSDYYDLVSLYSQQNFIDMPVAYELDGGKHLLAGKDPEKFIELIDKNGQVIKRTDLPDIFISFVNIYKFNGYYYLYGTSYNPGKTNVTVYKLDNKINKVDEQSFSFANTKPFNEFKGYNEDINYYWDYSYGVKFNKSTTKFERIEAEEYPSFLTERDTIIKQQVNENASVDLIWAYQDGFAIMYRVKENNTYNFFIGYVVNNELKWSVPVINLTTYNINIFSDYIATIGYESGNGYVFNLYDEKGSKVSSEKYSNYHPGSMSGTYLRGGKDYLNVSVNVPKPGDSESSAIYFFKNPNHKYNIFISDSKNGEIVSSKSRASVNEAIKLTSEANTGYVLGTVKVVDEDGKEVPVENENFQMPQSNVIVYANFKEKGADDSSEADEKNASPKDDSKEKDEKNPNTAVYGTIAFSLFITFGGLFLLIKYIINVKRY